MARKSDGDRFVRIGSVRAKPSARGDRILSYHVEVSHSALNVHKELSAPSPEMLERKLETLLFDWSAKHEALRKRQAVATGKESAEQLAIDADGQRSRLRQTLQVTLKVNDKVDWGRLKDKDVFRPTAFMQPPPKPSQPPLRPSLRLVGFMDKLLGRRAAIEAENAARMADYDAEVSRQGATFSAAQAKWQADKVAWDKVQTGLKVQFQATQTAENAKVDELEVAWREADTAAVMEHATLVLEASKHDPLIPKDFTIHYDAATRLLVVDYRLPAPETLPSIKSVRFIASTGEIKETHLPQKELNALFDDLCYQVCLRTIHELFEADEPHNIDSIVFNGTCESLNRATGQTALATILSLRAERMEFMAINLAAVDPKECFKKLKGVAASTLSGLTPIPPLVSLSKDDKRFIEGRSVDLGSDGSVNLASMSWEDFEHLVRELFEKEFAARGGEVRVTQASSDGGVDAVAFDPDPISGGKIVIQAKRYTKTVGVSAVRDLYGTVMNEGASKGILVTTSDFGPDAHKFAAGKPLTLMGGSNLLFLLERHGMKARIDIGEARRDLGLR